MVNRDSIEKAYTSVVLATAAVVHAKCFNTLGNGEASYAEMQKAHEELKRLEAELLKLAPDLGGQ